MTIVPTINKIINLFLVGGLVFFLLVLATPPDVLLRMKLEVQAIRDLDPGLLLLLASAILVSLTAFLGACVDGIRLLLEGPVYRAASSARWLSSLFGCSNSYDKCENMKKKAAKALVSHGYLDAEDDPRLPSAAGGIMFTLGDPQGILLNWVIEHDSMHSLFADFAVVSLGVAVWSVVQSPANLGIALLYVFLAYALLCGAVDRGLYTREAIFRHIWIKLGKATSPGLPTGPLTTP